MGFISYVSNYDILTLLASDHLARLNESSFDMGALTGQGTISDEDGEQRDATS
jgi:hypothetical protein